MKLDNVDFTNSETLLRKSVLGMLYGVLNDYSPPDQQKAFARTLCNAMRVNGALTTAQTSNEMHYTAVDEANNATVTLTLTLTLECA